MQLAPPYRNENSIAFAFYLNKRFVTQMEGTKTAFLRCKSKSTKGRISQVFSEFVLQFLNLASSKKRERIIGYNNSQRVECHTIIKLIQGSVTGKVDK